MSKIKPTRLKIDKRDLLDGDVFYFPGDPMYLYQFDVGATYVFGDEVGLPLKSTRPGVNEVIVIHNCYENRRDFDE